MMNTCGVCGQSYWVDTPNTAIPPHVCPTGKGGTFYFSSSGNVTLTPDQKISNLEARVAALEDRLTSGKDSVDAK
jgi:hypothetical protein